MSVAYRRQNRDDGTFTCSLRYSKLKKLDDSIFFFAYFRLGLEEDFWDFLTGSEIKLD